MGSGVARYYWINDHETLIFPRNRTNDPPLSHILARYDILTGKEAVLDALTKQVQSIDNLNGDAVSVAPDGKRLCWIGPHIASNHATPDTDSALSTAIRCATFEGTPLFDIVTHATGPCIWMADNTHVLQYEMEYGSVVSCTIYDTNMRQPTWHGNFPPGIWIGTITTNNHYLIGQWDGADEPDWIYSDSAQITDIELGKEQLPVKKYTVHMPFKIFAKEMLFSPKGDRIAWPLMQYAATPSPVDAWLHKLIPSFKLPPKAKFGLWISHIDGSEMHEIGYVPLKPDLINGGTMAEDAPNSIQWLPDGKRLSFQYKNNLYIIPVD